jgi:hypothetical protein
MIDSVLQPIVAEHSTALQPGMGSHVASAASAADAAADKHDCHLPNARNWCTNRCPPQVRSSVPKETIAQIVNDYELAISCEKCGAQSQQTIGWIRQHRDMKCPGCDAVIVLNTSRITGTIRSVERRLGDLQTQLTERIRKL